MGDTANGLVWAPHRGCHWVSDLHHRFEALTVHPEAFSGFGWAIIESGLDPSAPLRVLDVGGQFINGNVHAYWENPDTVITTLDLENADIIADAATWEPDQLFDVVCATELFEHVERWPQIIATMRRALDPAGPGVLLATCASTDRYPHGATGAPSPAPGEWYHNVEPSALSAALRGLFRTSEIRYQYPPGDAYCWARVDWDRPEVTVIIPTIPGRTQMLAKAVQSAWDQTLQPTDVIVEQAGPGEGPSVVRNRALGRVETEWVAFLDDDDWFHPNHLDVLTRLQVETSADVCWPWFTVEGGKDPFPMFRGRQWNPDDPHQLPITVLARTEALRAVGGFQTIPDGPTDAMGNRAGEDWTMWLTLSAAGYRFAHTPEQTWVWKHWSGNTSGLSSRR